MRLIDGRALAAKIHQELKKKISALELKPGLGVILVGDDPASHLYVRLKEKACAEVGINFEKKIFPANTPEEIIIETIEQWNAPSGHPPQGDNGTIIHGILVQLPLPSHLDAGKIISAIDPKKDADGFHPENIRTLKAGQPFVEPVLAKAIWQLIQEAMKQGDNEKMKETLIIGNSDVFTESLEIFLRQKGLNAIHLHPDQVIKNKIQTYDFLIVAVGQPNFLTGHDFKDGAIVIDVGINRLPDGRNCGDVNFESTRDKNGWITPVPGGVGPMTVAMLLENVYLLSL